MVRLKVTTDGDTFGDIDEGTGFTLARVHTGADGIPMPQVHGPLSL